MGKVADSTPSITSICFTRVTPTEKGHIGFISFRFGRFCLNDIAVYKLRYPEDGKTYRLVYPLNERTNLNTFHPTDKPTSKMIEEKINSFLDIFFNYGGQDDSSHMEPI